jgi:hypothetical protein
MQVFLIKSVNGSSFFGNACDPKTYRSSIACYKTKEIALSCAKKMILFKNTFERYPTLEELTLYTSYTNDAELNGYGELEIIKTDFSKMEYFFTVQNISLLMFTSYEPLEYYECPYVMLDHSILGNVLDHRFNSNNLDDNIDLV